MTIQEAINSKKPFKRANWREGAYLVTTPAGTFSWADDCDRGSVTVRDICATDWELEKVTLEIKLSLAKWEIYADAPPGSQSSYEIRLKISDEQYEDLVGVGSVTSLELLVKGEK